LPKAVLRSVVEWLRNWRRTGRRVLFLTMRWLMRRCGFGGARRIGAVLGAAHYLFGAVERRRCLYDLALLQQREPGDPFVTQQLREAYRVNTIAVLEVLAMVDRKLDVAMLKTKCRLDGLSLLEAARSGRGAIVLATHSGNSLLLAVQLASEGWPITVVYRQADMMSAEFFAQGLPRYGINGILANEGFRAYAQMIDALRRNGVLFAMVDQGVKAAESGVPMRFLGKDMSMPGGVIQLARQSRAPILPVVTLAAEPVWQFALQPPIAFQPGGTLEEDLGIVLRNVEQQVLARPQLWSWHQRRWRDYALAAPKS
jgi:lauroyl/myristoyl acyltransferase